MRTNALNLIVLFQLPISIISIVFCLGVQGCKTATSETSDGQFNIFSAGAVAVSFSKTGESSRANGVPTGYSEIKANIDASDGDRIISFIKITNAESQDPRTVKASMVTVVCRNGSIFLSQGTDQEFRNLPENFEKESGISFSSNLSAGGAKGVIQEQYPWLYRDGQTFKDTCKPDFSEINSKYSLEKLGQRGKIGNFRFESKVSEQLIKIWWGAETGMQPD